jgi:sugar/nucleoside kinase (ribokinase family)
MTGRVVCVGDLMVDVVALLPGRLDALAVGSDTPAPIDVISGGAGANTAAWLVHAGARSAFVGCAGDDVWGRGAVAELAAIGVETHVRLLPDAPTGTCVVLVTGGGERTMIPSRGANGRLTDSDVDAVPLDGADRLHVSGYSLLYPDSHGAAHRALVRAGEEGVPVSVDAASAEPLRAVGPAFLDWLPRNALLIANQAEAEVLTGRSDATASALALAERVRQVVVKLGPAGAVAAEGSRSWTGAAEQRPAVDSTGAGDAFAAGLLAALHQGGALPDALAAANRLGARAVTRVGARPAAG